MAQTNYTPISLYYSTTASAAPTSGNLVNGELAINITDGKLYYKSNAGTVTLLASAAGASGDVVGPSSATDNALVRFDTTTGKLVQNSVGILSDAGILTGLTGLTSSGNVTFSALTSGRVTFAGTGGLLSDSANLTWDGTTLSAVGRLYNGSASTFGASTWGMSLGNGGASANYFKAATTYWQNNSGTQIGQLDSTGLAVGASGAITSFTALGATSTSLGLSITASGWNNARHRLTVPTSGDSSVWSFNYSGSAVDFASYGTSAISVGSATITFGIGDANIAPSELGRFTTTGLGLNTTTPATSLHVVGTGALLAGNSPAVSATNPTYSGVAFGFDGANNLGQVISTNPSGAALGFYTKATSGVAPAQRMHITGSGFVGVGTITPITALQVNSGSLYVLGVKSTTTYGFISLQDGGTSGTLTDGTVAVGANVDDLVFRSGGANRARLGGTGNFGLGVTATAWLWPDGSTGVLQLQAGAAFSGYNAGAVVSQNWYYNAGEKFIGNGYASRYSQASGIHAWSVSTASNASGAGAALTWSESMRIATGGTVSMGDTATGYSARLYVNGSIAARNGGVDGTYQDAFVAGYTSNYTEKNIIQTAVSSAGGGSGFRFKTSDGGGSSGTTTTLDLNKSSTIFYTDGSERMRITNGGDGIFMFKSGGSVTTNGWQFTSTGGGMVFTQTNNEFFAWNNYNGSGTVQMDFRWNNSEVGAINMTSSGVAYTSISDARLKKNIVDAQDSGAIIDALRIREYDMIVDDRHVRFGLVYQEAAEIFPEGGHMPEGKYGMVDKTEYVPLLIKELQSLRKRLADAGIA